MITLDEIGKQRIEAKQDRGPWPSEYAKENWLHEAVKELSDTYEHLRVGADEIDVAHPLRFAMIVAAIKAVELVFVYLQLTGLRDEIEKLFGGTDEP